MFGVAPDVLKSHAALLPSFLPSFFPSFFLLPSSFLLPSFLLPSFLLPSFLPSFALALTPHLWSLLPRRKSPASGFSNRSAREEELKELLADISAAFSIHSMVCCFCRLLLPLLLSFSHHPLLFLLMSPSPKHPCIIFALFFCFFVFCFLFCVAAVLFSFFDLAVVLLSFHGWQRVKSSLAAGVVAAQQLPDKLTVIIKPLLESISKVWHCTHIHPLSFLLSVKRRSAAVLTCCTLTTIVLVCLPSFLPAFLPSFLCFCVP